MPVPKQNKGSSFQNYVTPKAFIAATQKKLGITQFAWDLAADDSNSQSPFGFFDEAQDSLKQDWWGLTYGSAAQWLWLNPPYSNIKFWVSKAAGVGGQNIACLLPASVGAGWYRDHVHNKAYVLFLNGRLAFIPDKPNWKYPKDLMLVLYNSWARGSDVWHWEP